MAKNYVEINIEKFTGPNVHPDDETLLGKVYGKIIYRFTNQKDLEDFINLRAGRLTYDNDGNRVAVIVPTAGEMNRIKLAAPYRG